MTRVSCRAGRDDVSRSDITPQMMGVGELGPVREIKLEDRISSIIGQRVIHVGRTTGLQRGIIAGCGYQYVDEDKHKVYTDLLILGTDGRSFSSYGDSGSLIVLDNEELNPIGLLWGGWQEKLRSGCQQENWTYGTSLSRVLKELDIDLVLKRSQIKKAH